MKSPGSVTITSRSQRPIPRGREKKLESNKIDKHTKAREAYRPAARLFEVILNKTLYFNELI